MEFIITIAIVLIALGVLFFGGAIYAFARHKKGIAAGCGLMGVIMAIALRLDLPSECLKLISAVIVALAIGLPAVRAAGKTAKGGK